MTHATADTFFFVNYTSTGFRIGANCMYRAVFYALCFSTLLAAADSKFAALINAVGGINTATKLVTFPYPHA